MQQVFAVVIALGFISLAAAFPRPYFVSNLQPLPAVIVPQAQLDLETAPSQWVPETANPKTISNVAKDKDDDLQVAEFNWGSPGRRSGWGHGNWGHYGNGGYDNGFGNGYTSYGGMVGSYGALGASLAQGYGVYGGISPYPLGYNGYPHGPLVNGNGWGGR